MLDLTKDLQSCSSFKKNCPQSLGRHQWDGGPLVLTINRKAELVVQNVTAYQKLREQAASSKDHTRHG
jgi:hypothetical protein